MRSENTTPQITLMASLHPCTCISKCGPEVNPLAVVHVVAAYVILWCRKKPFTYYAMNNDHLPACTSRQESIMVTSSVIFIGCTQYQ